MITDIELNKNMIDYNINRIPSLVSQAYQVIGNYENWHLSSYHNFDLKKRLYMENQYMYYDPVDGSFLSQGHVGKHIAQNIKEFYELEQAKSMLRVNYSSYQDILVSYQDILKADSDPLYYIKMRPLISIILAEQYMKLCPREELRKAYMQCYDQVGELYNRYMSAIR